MKVSRFLSDERPWKAVPRVAHKWEDRIVIWCPGCEGPHMIRVEGPLTACWQWNGSLEKPTIQPSLNVVGRCHSWISDGRIQFLSDCTHKLADQTVALPEWNFHE